MFGKPDVEHFEACIRKLQINRDRVAHVGDSLHHDIAGAIATNVPSVFVTSGIHASQLGTSFGEMPETNSLYNLFEQEGSIYPTHVVPAFRL
jgi:ribonucleotide monophosphatase NagD (HAD superfamily)